MPAEQEEEDKVRGRERERECVRALAIFNGYQGKQIATFAWGIVKMVTGKCERTNKHTHTCDPIGVILVIWKLAKLPIKNTQITLFSASSTTLLSSLLKTWNQNQMKWLIDLDWIEEIHDG